MGKFKCKRCGQHESIRFVLKFDLEEKRICLKCLEEFCLWFDSVREVQGNGNLYGGIHN